MSDSINSVQVVNMRSFFSREIFMHALGDFRFSKPIALKQALYTAVFFIIYSLPIVMIFGFHFNVYFAVITFIPPIALGNFANKPIWGGRTLVGFVKVTISYIGEPRGWTDHREDNGLGKEVYTVDHDIWVSRRRELKILAELRDEKELGVKTDNRIYQGFTDLDNISPRDVVAVEFKNISPVGKKSKAKRPKNKKKNKKASAKKSRR